LFYPNISNQLLVLTNKLGNNGFQVIHRANCECFFLGRASPM
jgi:hypothetical protein